MKEPKRYECTQCRFISNRYKTVKFPMMTFAICYKCKGKIQERKEWLDWMEERRQEHLKEIKKNGGYFLGRKVTEVSE